MSMLQRLTYWASKPVYQALATTGFYLVLVSAASAQSVGNMATNAKNDLASVPGLIMLVAAIIGIVLVIMGLMKFSKSRHTGEDTGAGIKMLIVGAVLLSVAAIIGAFSTTMFGSNQAGNTLGNLQTSP